MEGVVHADQGRGFGQAVTLDHGIAEPFPELLGRLVQCGASGDEGPEFPSELAVDTPEDPPAGEEVLAFRRPEATLKVGGVASALEITHDLFTQRMKHAGNRH